MRIVLAGIVGAIAMFIWQSIAHMSPLGEVGVSEIKNEEPVLFAMQSAVGTTDGLYMFPAMRSGTEPLDEVQYEGKLKTLPSGILVYHPPGGEGLSVQRLVTEFASEAVESILLALILFSTSVAGFLPRLGIAAAVGGCAVVSTNVSYWNWYGFPADYTLSYMAIDFVGYLVAGLAILAFAQWRGMLR